MSTDHGPVYYFAVASNQLKPEIPMPTALREASDDEGDATGAAPKVEPDETQIDIIEHPNTWWREGARSGLLLTETAADAVGVQ